VTDKPSPAPVPATAVLHQEGILAVLALVGLFLRGTGPLPALLPVASWLESLSAGLFTAIVLLIMMSGGLLVPAVRTLELWQRGLVQDWTVLDAIAVAVFSGLAEEALIRALLQPWIGLMASAGIFALLHIIPDRRLWVWPVLALILGLILGLVFDRWGFPAVAIAHVIINMVSLLRLRRLGRPLDD